MIRAGAEAFEVARPFSSLSVAARADSMMITCPLAHRQPAEVACRSVHLKKLNLATGGCTMGAKPSS